jgi:hypothetical protein
MDRHQDFPELNSSGGMTRLLMGPKYDNSTSNTYYSDGTAEDIATYTLLTKATLREENGTNA